MTDNLRPNLGCYRGHSYPERSPDAPHVHTPWLDSLAGDSALFERAYVQWPYCGPSRAAILTGRRVYHLKTFICIVPLKVPMVVHRRPDSTLQHSNRKADSFCLKPGASFATSRRRVIDLPLFFRENGFYTAGFGKVRLDQHSLLFQSVFKTFSYQQMYHLHDFCMESYHKFTRGWLTF